MNFRPSGAARALATMIAASGLLFVHAAQAQSDPNIVIAQKKVQWSALLLPLLQRGFQFVQKRVHSLPISPAASAANSSAVRRAP